MSGRPVIVMCGKPGQSTGGEMTRVAGDHMEPGDGPLSGDGFLDWNHVQCMCNSGLRSE